MTIGIMWCAPDSAHQEALLRTMRQQQQQRPVYQQDRPAAPAPAPREGAHRSDLVLLSADNPGGWKLEELLVQLRREIEADNAEIGEDSPLVPLVPSRLSPTARAAREFNQKIMAALFTAEGYRRDQLAALNRVGRPRLP